MSYFEVKLADQDKDLAPYIACKSNTKKGFWSLGKTRHVPFAIVMIWREAKIINQDNNYIGLEAMARFQWKTKVSIEFQK